jgi:hypothetical protein
MSQYIENEDGRKAVVEIHIPGLKTKKSAV